MSSASMSVLRALYQLGSSESLLELWFVGRDHLLICENIKSH